MKNIIFVCTGNTCRSPMAMAVLRDKFLKKGITDVYVDSAGLAALGDEINPNSVKALKKIGINFSDYHSKSLTTDMLYDADLVVTMTKDQEIFLRGIAQGKTEISVLGEGISDPFGGDENVYQNCLEEISKGIDNLFSEGKI